MLTPATRPAAHCHARQTTQSQSHGTQKKESTEVKSVLSFAFRRATAGSRGRRKIRGSRKRGQETLVSCPLLPLAPGGARPCTPQRAFSRPPGVNPLPFGARVYLASCVCAAVSAYRSRSPSEGEKGAPPQRENWRAPSAGSIYSSSPSSSMTSITASPRVAST